MIRINKYCKYFSTELIETHAVNTVSLEVKQGDFLSIMGPSGCGKSTLINLLGLLDTPNSGNYFFKGEKITFSKKSSIEKIRNENFSYIFQDFNLIETLTVTENIELPLLYRGVPKKSRDLQILDVLEKTSMLERKDHFPKELSGGQQQRVAVARALVTNPQVIFADEPTGNLDSKNGHDVMNLLSELNENGSTIVMVTHSKAHATYGSRIINLLDGQVKSEAINEIL